MLLQAIAQSLIEAAAGSAAAAAFWQSRGIDEIAQDQQVPIVHDSDALAGNFWPDDESVDDLLAYLAEQRRVSREGPQ